MRIRLAAAIAAILLLLTPSAWPADLEAGFRQPPDSAKPHTWWHWVNGNSSKAGITADLEAMKRAGIGGAQIFNVDCGLPSGPVPFMSAAWREQIQHAVKEADRLGLELCIHNCAGWSSSGGPWITPEHAMQILTFSERTVHGPAAFGEALAQPDTRGGYYRDVAVLAFRVPPAEAAGQPLRIQQIRVKAGYDRGDRIRPDTAPTPEGAAIPREGVVDLSARMAADGRLTWDVPEGDWVILRIGHTLTGAQNAPAPAEGRGLECDKLSREAMDAHWAGMMATVLKDIGPLAGKVLNNALIDSYEVGCQNWTPRFREEFLKRRGYDLLPYLPVVQGRVVDSIETSERFLWDFRRTIADLWAENYFGYFAELCRKHGMLMSVEPYGNGVFDNLQSGGVADVPMGEFWVGGGAGGSTKLAASVAHTYGRKFVGAESFTADDQHAKWLVDPWAMKALGDAVFCMGVNRYIFHRYAHQPWIGLVPGLTMGPWGTMLERTVTWWDQAHAWLAYVARCQYLLQSGLFVADAVYYEGEEAPNDLPGPDGLPAGYDYDGCDTGVLLNRLTVRDGRLWLPDGASYRVLVLPDSPFMTPQVLAKVRDLVRAGATVLGPKPSKSPSLAGHPQCDEEVRRLANEVWGDADGKTRTEHAFGQGRAFWGRPLKDVLAALAVKPDFAYAAPSPSARLVYIHRSVEGADVYFVSNQRYSAQEVTCTFRVSGKRPELWRPDTGAVEPAPAYREVDGLTEVPLRLDPAGSVFVVFRSAAAGDHLVSVTRTGPVAPGAAAPRIGITKARYEAADGRGVDVTQKVAAMVAAGETAIAASNEMFGDPTPLVVKRLSVEYTLNGKPMQQTVPENGTLELAGGGGGEAPPPVLDLRVAGGRAEAVPWQAGVIEARAASGKTRRVRVRQAAAEAPVPGPWTVRFDPARRGPAEVRFDRLISWPEHTDPNVRYYSGAAEYTTQFRVPAAMLGRGRVVSLDLGRVKNLAEVAVNGRSLGVLWKVPFRVDVTGLLKPGVNALSVKVVNLWPNRLIGDEQLPAEAEYAGGPIKAWPDWVWSGQVPTKRERVTFTTWHFFDKGSPLLESGLLGPVVMRSARAVPLQ